jgi:DUF1680 family protein
MKAETILHLILTAAAAVTTPVMAQSTQPATPTHETLARDYPVEPVPFTAVHLNDVFWAPRVEINRTVTIPYAFQKCEETGRLYNFERAAARLRGEEVKDTTPPGFPFDDTDIYKILEGACYGLSVHPDPKMDAYLDMLIAKIGAAQEPDGYLYPARTIDPAHPHPWSGPQRWVNEKDLSHELYDLGHLYEAAVAHYQATGKRSLLEIAIKSADLLDRTFGPGKQSIWPGHQIVEMGLVKLARVTGEQRYLKLAKFMLDERGPDGSKGAGRDYNQSRQKIVDQTEAVGHAVRATYMYSGVADVAALTGDTAYVKAIDRIWDNAVGAKLAITGGIGAMHSGEAFGRNYFLPNMDSYNETCAAVGNDYWNYRLFLLHADAKYMDVFDRTLYNGLISGVSLDGKAFFYPNPLESNGQHRRDTWFGCACCPGNIARFMASIPGYVYAHDDQNLYVNLYAASTATVEMGQKVELKQETNYPWDGAIKIVVNPATNASFAINLRIPGWARNEPVPTDLYRFADTIDEPLTLKVNGQPVEIKLENGYAKLQRQWNAGETVELNLPMPVRRVLANDQVAADRDRVAIQRGPIVYCAEWSDNVGGHVRNLVLPDDATFSTEWKADLLGGVTVIRSRATAVRKTATGEIETAPQDLALIPYSTWANRGPGEMVVWMARTPSAAVALPPPTIASTASIKLSGGATPRPQTRFDWWPSKGTTQFAEFTFAKPAEVSRFEVFFFDDTGRGESKVPQSWKLLYRDGETWKPIESTDPFPTRAGRFNAITFKPVTTDALRIEMTFQKDWSGGIQEWKAE